MRQLALTFDDGPGADTPAFVELLQRFGAGATFFVVGCRIAGREETLERVAASGCEVGNHTFTHRPLSQLGDEAAAAEMQLCSDAIAAVTGSPPALLRPPLGELGPSTARVASELGLTTVMWSILGLDFDGRASPDTIVGALIDGARPGAVPILHDAVLDRSLVSADDRRATLRALETAVPALLGAGYDLVTLSQLLETEKPRVEQGLPVAITERGRRRPRGRTVPGSGGRA